MIKRDVTVEHVENGVVFLVEENRAEIMRTELYMLLRVSVKK